MSHTLRVAWTIARRDYVAAVFSRIFVLFLCLPLLVIGLGIAFGAIGAQGHAPPPPSVVSVPAADFRLLAEARGRLVARLGEEALPQISTSRHADDAVLTGTLDRPRLRLSGDADDGLVGEMGLILDTARVIRAAGGAPVPARLVVERSRVTAVPASGDRVGLAQGAQYVILVLTVMLGGRLLSSFIEERSNKVIEVLAAAVPVDAIFIGKLIGMLLFSLTCAAAWGLTLLAGALLLAPQLLAGIATPAVGWPVFVPLTLLYFAATYVLLGAVLLGLGAQANSPSDVQTLALPTTLAQLGLFGLASVDVGRPDHWIAHVAAIVPWSSALAMAARAAERPQLWPHALAILWQAAWVWLTIRFAAARFRRAVLKTGSARPRRPASPRA